MTSTTPRTHLTSVHTVAVPVTDQDRALAFYVDVLGCEVRMDASYGPGARWLEVAPPGAPTTLALVRRESGPAGVDTGIRLATTDAAADHATLLAAGVDVDAELVDLGPQVPPMFTFRDPDGNTLVVVELEQPA
jgi:catechol 2,3-dioxygenase-like lactoylglutathione lyase family enzyme